MKKQNFKLIHILVDKDDYSRLQEMQSSKFPSVSHIIRDLIHMAVNTSVEIKPPEMKPLSVLTNPVVPEVVKTPLEIPVIEDSSVIESVSLIHRTGRRLSPNTLAIKMAKRAKDMGRPYDVSMEQHFHILDEL